MPRPKSAIPGVSLHVVLPQDLHARMELDLYSPAEQRIPFNAKGKLIAKLLREYYEEADRRFGQPHYGHGGSNVQT